MKPTAINRCEDHMAKRLHAATWREIVYTNARKRYDLAWRDQPEDEAGTIELRLARANLRAAAGALVAEIDGRR